MSATLENGGLSAAASRRRFVGMLGAAAAAPLLPARAQGSKHLMRIAHVLTEADNVHRALVKFKEAAEK
jgi:TRAP-type C4-dicarboxylate transport system substrate-binding protein